MLKTTKASNRVSGRRDRALVELSRDHHQALTQALWLKRADGSNKREVIRNFMGFWSPAGRRHFAIEEELLLPAFARYCGSTDELIVRVLAEHVEIRMRVAELEDPDSVSVSKLNQLGELLDAHVRLEERYLFERMQQVMSREELDALAAAIVAAERGQTT